MVFKNTCILILSLLLLSCQKEKTQINDNADYHDFNNEETIHSLGEYNLLINSSSITFHPENGFINAPLEYHNSNTQLNFNNLYKITDEKNNAYHFRFGWLNYNNEATTLVFIHWLDNSIPPHSITFKKYKLEVINVPFHQFGNQTICTIGDSQTWYEHAAQFRLLMNNKYPELKFVGSNTDIYSYPHEGEGGNSSKEVLERINAIPEADIYTLLLGTNDLSIGLEASFENLKTITSTLHSKYPLAKILYLSPLPTTINERDTFNRSLENKMDTFILEHDYLTLIPLGREMRKHQNWAQDYLVKDGLHPNIVGVNFAADITVNWIKSYE